MKRLVLPAFLAGMILLVVLAVPVTAESSTITSVSPAVGYTGSSATVTITGTNFNLSSVQVRLRMDDESNLSATVTSLTATQIVCRFTLSSSKTTGDWDLVVVNEDESEVVKAEGFTIRKPMTLTAVSPATAQVNNDSVEVIVAGTYLSDVAELYLYNEDYDNVTASYADPVSSTRVEATFDLTGAEEGTYEVCAVDSFGTAECDLAFEITTDAVGSIAISSSPTDASIYVDGSYTGTTPGTAENLIEGYHKVVLKKAGYSDWGKMVTVTAGDVTTVDADLAGITTVPTTVPPPAATPDPTTLPATARTTRASTLTVPTTWPVTTATTSAPLDPAVIIGAAGIGLGFGVLRRR